MSHDLFFTKPQISQAEFLDYFRQRANYELSDSQAFYNNENTGVYFIIGLNHEANADDKDDEEESLEFTASANVNLYRPHVFGLEAAEEISAFVQRFGFSVLDPQDAGMGDGPYSKEGFIRSWNNSNEFGYSAILKREDAPSDVYMLTGERIEAIWRWNRAKAAVQESVTDDRFVPRIFMMAVQGKAMSVAVWPDAIPALIPQVDLLLIGRKELAPRSFFGISKEDTILVPFAELAIDLAPYATSTYSLPAFNLPSPIVPDLLRNRIRKLKATGIQGEGIAFQDVLNEELVLKAKARG